MRYSNTKTYFYSHIEPFSMERTIDLVNERIRDGNAVVVTAERMPDLVAELGEEGALAEVDVVTTGTFGAMCSSGVFLNFGHADPPIRMERVWLNDVEAYAGIAAVDAYLGATQQSETRRDEYGGAHVIEDLVSGNSVELRAHSRGTDCYPRRTVRTEVGLSDLNQAVMVNPRNAYQRYNAAVNTSDRVLHTYMGMLLPNHGNVTYSGAGVLNPISNDPTFRYIGAGVPIFLGGGEGVIIGEGTQHSPAGGFGTLMVSGDMKGMSSEYLRAATMHGYGVTLYVGLGVPIPVLDIETVRATAVTDAGIEVDVVDYSVPERSRPTIRTVSYADLRSGKVMIEGEEVTTSPLSSFRRARQVAEDLAERITAGRMTLALPTRRIDATRSARPMREIAQGPRVREIMDRQVVSITGDDPVTEAAKKLLKGETNHLVVLDGAGRLAGIVTTYDLSKAVLRPERARSVANVMTRRVITTVPDEPVDIAAQKLRRNNISALPVVDADRRVVGMLTANNLSRLIGRGRE
ncbi:Inosine-5'-monophosphate dehydrogenase [anaerobic digester metagenome]